MKFRRTDFEDRLEINFIPLIDLLLVVVIFLVVTTSYGGFGELKINLPAGGASVSQRVNTVNVAITAEGDYQIGDRFLGQANFVTLRRVLAELISSKDVLIVINADRGTAHANVIKLLQASQSNGFTRITFATNLNELVK